jgi:hypothetical protein
MRYGACSCQKAKRALSGQSLHAPEGWIVSHKVGIGDTQFTVKEGAGRGIVISILGNALVNLVKFNELCLRKSSQAAGAEASWPDR